jgi:hypothetical protein
LSQRTDDPELDIELGVPPVMPGGVWQDWSGGLGGNLPNGAFVVGRDPTAPAMSEMVSMIRRDGQARALLNLLTLPIRGTLATGRWHPPGKFDKDTPEVEFANAMWNLPHKFGGMQVSKSKFLRQQLLSFAYGFSAFEHVRYVPKDGPLKGQVCIKKLSYRDPRTVWFMTDDKGNYLGFRQTTSFANRAVNVVIPDRKAYHYTVLDEENPMYGVSLFEPAFEHHQIKRKLYYISHLAAQFSAVPGRVAEMPPGASRGRIEQVRQALQQFAFSGAMMLPQGWKLSAPFTASNQFNFMQLIDHHNTMMASSVLAKFLQQEDRQVLIDNGKADASADMFVQMLDSYSDEISESWSREIMPQYIDYNFNSGEVPEFRFGPLTDDQRTQIQSMFQTVVVAGTLNCTPEFVRQLEERLSAMFGLDVDYDKISRRERAAAKAQAAAQLQEQQQEQQAGAEGGGEGGPGAGPGGPAGAGPGGAPAGGEGGPPGAGGPPAGGRPPAGGAGGGGGGAAGPPVAASAVDQALDGLLLQLSQITGYDVTNGPLDDIDWDLEP